MNAHRLGIERPAIVEVTVLPSPSTSSLEIRKANVLEYTGADATRTPEHTNI